MTRSELIAENRALKEHQKVSDQKIAELEGQLKGLLKLIYASKSERFKSSEDIPDQLHLFGDSELAGPPVVLDTKTIEYEKKIRKKHNGRNPIPEHLPVKEIVIEPEENTTGLKKIGEEITETLEYTPASLVKKRIIRPKYAKANDEGVLIGKLPRRPIDKCIAEASLLAYILISKFSDHLPFYRLIQMFKRDFDWQVCSSTINDWMAACCTLMEPLYEKLKEKVLNSGYVQADESPIKVLDKDKKGSTHQGYQWVYHAPEQGLVLFNYRKGRGQHGPKEMLSDYQGYLQSDGYKVYDKIGAAKDIILVGCLAHARRKYFDAKDSDKARAEYALNLIGKIYKIERQIKELAFSPDEITGHRKIHTQPLFDELIAWIKSEQHKILPKSPIGKAMNYTQSQWPKLTAILQDGRLEIDNNLIENSIRPLALGRKNYLFSGSHKGAQRIAMMYSFLGSCKKQNINPRIWLTETLEKLPDHPINKIEELLPGYKKEGV